MESVAVFAGLHPNPGHHNSLIGPSRTPINLLPPSIDRNHFSPLPLKVFFFLQLFKSQFFSFILIEIDAVLWWICLIIPCISIFLFCVYKLAHFCRFGWLCVLEFVLQLQKLSHFTSYIDNSAINSGNTFRVASPLRYFAFLRLIFFFFCKF